MQTRESYTPTNDHGKHDKTLSSSESIFNLSLKNSTDTLPIDSNKILLKDTSQIKDSLPSMRDSASLTVDTVQISKDSLIPQFSFPISKDTLNGKVKYDAEDSMVLDLPTKTFHLYGKTTVHYNNINLKAARVDFDQSTNLLKAKYAIDSGKHKGAPIFHQKGQDPFQSDSMVYNFKTQNGKIYNTVTKQGEGFLYSDEVRKLPDNSINSHSAFFTTCDVDPPHFGFQAKRVKIIPNKVLISGPANLVVEDVPTPLFIPFAIFPLSHGQRTGILPPTYEVTQQKGIGLTNGGYYFGLGEHFDLTVRGDIYSYGSWGLRFNPRYYKRYKYSGSLNLSINSTRFGDPQTPDFTKSKDFRITWSHRMDPKAHPGVSFSASVNAGTSSYTRYNVRDAHDRLNNILNSSISFSKNWKGSPFSLTLNANHSQNTSTERINLTLPSMSFNMSTIYPFQTKDFVGTPKWYQKIGVGYSLSMRNSVSVKEKDFLGPDFFKKFKTGIQHRVPISLSLPAFNFLHISPSISYTERWYLKKRELVFDPSKNKLDTTLQRGFYTARDITTGLSLGSTVYGMFRFNKKNKDAKIQAIRHVVRPSISLSYKPDLNKQYYYNVRVDTSNTVPKQRFSYFDNIGNGPFSEGRFGGLSFSLENSLEMKVHSDKDTANGGIKKVKILEGFGISGSYNLVADSFNLSNFSLHARTTLFKKMNISAQATIDPYVHNKYGRRIDKYVWEQGQFSPGKLTNGSLSFSTNFKSKQGQKNQNTQETEEENPLDNTLNSPEEEARRRRENPEDYVNFDIPWSVNMSYSLNFRKTRTPDYKRDTTIYAQSLRFSGSFNLTPKWKVSLSSGFDFIHKKLTYTTINITRDLHCWRMNISIVPMGFYKSFSITISPTSNLLHDLKISRNRQFYDVFDNGR